MAPTTSFLDLPAEIRNTIYEIIAHQTDGLRLKCYQPGAANELFISESNIIAASHQIKDEYYSVLQRHALTSGHTIKMPTIQDFDFASTISALTKVLESKALVPVPTSYLSIAITLNMTFNLETCAIDRLEPWLAFFEHHPAIEAEYNIHVLCPIPSKFGGWLRLLDQYSPHLRHSGDHLKVWHALITAETKH